MKKPRETQKETAAINRTYGNASLALKLDIEFVQMNPTGPAQGSRLLLPAALAAPAQLTAQPSEQGEVERRLEAGIPPARGSV